VTPSPIVITSPSPPMASARERATKGARAREEHPPESLGSYAADSSRPDPVALLEQQAASRVAELVPIRYGRMLASPFAFYRGAALIMASDLSTGPRTGLDAQLCGAPDRQPVFDLNDFDETNPGPFEWDVKRLATSFVLAAQDLNFSKKTATQAAAAAAREYRVSMGEYAAKNELDIWYERADASSIAAWSSAAGRGVREKVVSRSMSRAQTRTVWTAVNKLTTVVDGRRRFIDDPPLILRVPPDTAAWEIMQAALPGYYDTLAPDRRALLRRYEPIDLGHKVVGVGSVGLLAWVLLLQGRDPDDILVLQMKQAQKSVLEPYTVPSVYAHSGERVVQGQRLTQAASDSFLGWVSGALGRQYYVRQLRDMKWSPDPSTFRPTGLTNYAELCGHVLARAHARSGDAVAMAAYLGNSTTFDDAIASFALSYADQVQEDFASFQAAVADGRLAGGEMSTQLELYLEAMRNPKPAPVSS